MPITNVGVVGCGLMGSGIVQVAAQAGFQVLFVEADDELVKRGLMRLHETLEGLVKRGKIEARDRDAAVTLHEEVFEARTVVGGQIRSSFAKVSFFNA